MGQLLVSLQNRHRIELHIPANYRWITIGPNNECGGTFLSTHDRKLCFQSGQDDRKTSFSLQRLRSYSSFQLCCSATVSLRRRRSNYHSSLFVFLYTEQFLLPENWVPTYYYYLFFDPDSRRLPGQKTNNNNNHHHHHRYLIYITRTVSRESRIGCV